MPMRFVIAPLLFYAIALSGAGHPILTSLPSGKIKVDIMQPMASPRAAELTAKLLAAIKKEQEWWLSHVQKAEPGQPLPYDPRLGLTPEEYQEFQGVVKEVRLAKAAEAELEFRSSANGEITLLAGESIGELNGIRINTRVNVVETPFGSSTDRSDILASDEQRATGPWSGIQWKLEKPGETPGSGTIMKFALGRLTQNGRGILYYDAKHIEPDRTGRKASRILVFDLVAERPPN